MQAPPSRVIARTTTARATTEGSPHASAGPVDGAVEVAGETAGHTTGDDAAVDDGTDVNDGTDVADGADVDDGTEEEPVWTDSRWGEARWAVIGGLFAAGGVFVVAALVGRVSAFEARRLVEGIKPTATFAASTYVGAGATILALMATMIAFSISHESEFRRSHYRRLRMIATTTTALIVVSLALLTLLVVPIASADTPASGYLVIYWAILGLGALGGGLTVAIVLMLNYTVRGLINLGLHGTSILTRMPPDDEPTDEPSTSPNR